MYVNPVCRVAVVNLNLPFAEELFILSDLSDESPAIHGLDPQSVDVDGGSCSYLQRNNNAGLRIPSQQSSSGDQGLTAGYFLPKPTTSFGLMQSSKNHTSGGLINTKLLSPVNIHLSQRQCPRLEFSFHPLPE
jgi:hypothetical protein